MNWENRPWGRYSVIYDGEDMKVKIIEVNPEYRLSYQSHLKRMENWLIVMGEGFVILDGRRIDVAEGDNVFIGRNQKHTIGNSGQGVLRFVEVQRGDYFGEDDIVRYEDDFGRI
mgnify:CR=1 FL=1